MVQFDCHLHTNYTDGRSFPEEMVKTSIKLGLKRIAFTEHFNDKSLWFGKFFKEISGLKNKYSRNLEILVGVEVKIMNTQGDILLPEKTYPLDVVIASFHGLPLDSGTREDLFVTRSEAKIYGLWRKAVLNICDNPEVTMLGHVTAIGEKYRINEELLIKDKELIKKIRDKDIIIEANNKYESPSVETIARLLENEIKISYGSDSHSCDDLVRSQKSKYFQQTSILLKEY